MKQTTNVSDLDSDLKLDKKTILARFLGWLISAGT